MKVIIPAIINETIFPAMFFIFVLFVVLAKREREEACNRHTRTEGYDTLQEDARSYTPVWGVRGQRFLQGGNVVISVRP